MHQGPASCLAGASQPPKGRNAGSRTRQALAQPLSGENWDFIAKVVQEPGGNPGQGTQQSPKGRDHRLTGGGDRWGHRIWAPLDWGTLCASMKQRSDTEPRPRIASVGLS